MGKFKSFLLGWFFSLFWHATAWVTSLPALVTLILHFTIGLNIGWFWGTLALWLVVGTLRYLLIRFARWGVSGDGESENKANRNPYSKNDSDLFKG